MFIFIPSLVSAHIPSLWNVPDRNSNFVSREQLEGQLRELYRLHPHGVIAITGLSGLGKTELAKQYVHQTYAQYEVVWWFDANQDLQTQYYQFGTLWNATFKSASDQIPLKTLSNEGVVTYVKNLLRSTDRKWLLIFDNVKSKDSLSPFLPLVHESDPSQKHILVTSQNMKWDLSLPMGLFTAEEASALISSVLKEATQEERQALLDVTGAIPFYLGQTLDYIKTNKLTISEYLNPQNAHERSIDMTTFDRFSQKIATLKTEQPLAYEMLVLLSLSDSMVLSSEVLDHFFSQKSQSFADIIAILEVQGVIQERLSGSETNYVVHDIVKSSVRDTLSKAEIKSETSLLITVFSDLLEKDWEEMVAYALRKPEVVAQAQLAWELGHQNAIVSSDLFRLGLILMEYHIYKTREHKRYETLFDQMTVMKEKFASETINPLHRHKFAIDSVYIRSIYQNEGSCFKLSKELAQAVEHFQASKDPDLYLRALYNTAQFWLFQGDIKRARECLLKAEPLLASSKSRSNVNLYWYVCAWVAVEGADLDAAQKALEHFFKTFNEEQNYVLKLYGSNMQAMVSLESGDLEEALSWSHKSLEGAKTFFQNEDSEITAEALMIQAKVHVLQKNYESAQVKIEKSLLIYDRYFGGPDIHADQALALSLMGEASMALGKDDRALEAFMRAHKIYDTLYGDNVANIENVGALYLRIAKLGFKLQRPDLIKTYLQKHAEAFGTDHDRTTEIWELLCKVVA